MSLERNRRFVSSRKRPRMERRESTTRAGKHGDDDDDDDGDSGVDACEIERDGYEYASGGDVYGDALSRCVFWMERCLTRMRM